MDRTQRNNQLGAFAGTLEAVNAVMLVEDCAELGIDPSGLSAEQAATLVHVVRTLHMAPPRGERSSFEYRAFLSGCLEDMRSGMSAGDSITAAYEKNITLSYGHYTPGRSAYMAGMLTHRDVNYMHFEADAIERSDGDTYFCETLNGTETIDGYITPVRYVRLTHIDPDNGRSEIVMRAERLANATMAPLEIVGSYDWSSLQVSDHKMAISHGVDG